MIPLPVVHVLVLVILSANFPPINTVLAPTFQGVAIGAQTPKKGGEAAVGGLYCGFKTDAQIPGVGVMVTSKIVAGSKNSAFARLGAATRVPIGATGAGIGVTGVPVA